jgi:hypothetical protein
MGRAFVTFRPCYAGVLLLIMLAAVEVTTSEASPPSVIQPFFGRFEGKAIGRGDDETTNRDLAVVIQPDGDRFRIEWTTVTRQVDGEVKRKTYSIGFEPSQRPGIFRSTMRTDMFGHQVPLDPLKGDPYVWCHIAGRVLTLYSLQITDDGGYDLQIYERTLEGNLMSLHFTRLREGKEPKELTATLEKVPAVGKGD